MSVYRRKSNRWAVLIDVDDDSFRLVAELPPDKNQRRRTRTLGRFATADAAENARLRALAAGEKRTLSVERGRRRRACGTFRTRKEAEQAERDAIGAAQRGIELAPRTTTVADVVARFLADVGTRLERRTIERYDDLARLHITPSLGRLAIGKLRAAHVSDLYARLLTEGSGGRRLAPRTVHHVHRLLHRIVGWAERMQLVERNVVRAADPPKLSTSEATALGPDEVAALLSAAEGSRWVPIFALAFATGARRGELLALTWPDVNLEAATVLIRRSLVQTRAGISVKSTKTDRARSIPLSRLAREALRRARVQQAEDRLAAGALYDDRGYVFADELGAPIRPHAASDAFRFYAKRAKISTTRLHSARHTAATVMLGAGTDVRTVAGILGHSAPSTTLNVYGHLIAARSSAAVDVLSDELERARAKRTS